jgi:hypothetical protein
LLPSFVHHDFDDSVQIRHIAVQEQAPGGGYPQQGVEWKAGSRSCCENAFVVFERGGGLVV